MKPSMLEIRRVQAVEELASEIKAIIERLDQIENKLDKALAVKAGKAVKASPEPVSETTDAEPK